MTKISRINFSVEKAISISLANVLQFEHTPKATVLVYHDIPLSKNRSHLQNDSVCVEEFENQMKFLHDEDYKVMPLKHLVNHLRSGKKIPRKAVVITFDDGYKNVYTNAFPILKKYLFSATVFIATAFMNNKKVFPWLKSRKDNLDLNDSYPMNWEEIRELHKEGIEIGSHTMTHNFLPKLNAEIIEKEILKSQVVIKKQLDQTPQSLALPFSFPIKCRSWPTFESLLIKCLEKGNYTSCCTMVRGHVKLRDNLFFLKRIPVLKNDDILSFNAKLVGAYAWSRYTQ